MEKERSYASLTLSSILCVLILCAALIEGAYGFLQLCGVYHSLHKIFPVTGTFYNPGPFGCFLAISYPLAFAETINGKGGLQLLAIIVILIDTIMLPISISRTAWCAAVIGSLIFLMPKIIHLFHRYKSWIPLILITILIVSTSIYYLKENSANGRLLIWKIALTTIKLFPFSGSGPQYIGGSYGEAQEKYFAETERPNREILVADAPDFVFNEYLQTAIAYGWGVALFLIILLLIAFFTALKNHKFYISGCLGASMIVMFASYPFQFLLSTSTIFIIVGWAFLSSKKLYIRIIGIIAAIVFPIYIFHPFDRKEVKDAFDVGYALHKAGKWKQSNEHLMKIIPLTSDPMPLNIIGKNWQRLSCLDSAEHYMLRAVSRCPNRIYPHYLLMKLYSDTSAFPINRAKTEAYTILHMNIKVASPATDEMLRDARQILSR